jgi:hypothetical protein
MMAWISSLKSLMSIRKKISLSSLIALKIFELNLNILLFLGLVKKYAKLLCDFISLLGIFVNVYICKWMLPFNEWILLGQLFIGVGGSAFG